MKKVKVLKDGIILLGKEREKGEVIDIFDNYYNLIKACEFESGKDEKIIEEV